MNFFKYLSWVIMLTAVSVILSFLFNVFDVPRPNCNLEGKVVKLADGDSITVLDSDNVQHKIRLAGIDTPERKQPFGMVAKKFLSDKIANKTVCVGWYKEDRYQRLVGVVLFHDEDVNLSLVKAGLAWHYKAYQKEQSESDREEYAEAENAARKQRIGLWKDKDAVAPWEWRRR